MAAERQVVDAAALAPAPADADADADADDEDDDDDDDDDDDCDAAVLRVQGRKHTSRKTVERDHTPYLRA
eukprot:72148-Rhodomonas_salina.2